jgi:Ser/Thr protein kinase RdoA (MazF antagonist)
VKQFSEMNEAEQKAVLLEKVKAVIEKGKITNAEISWLAYTHNAVFSLKHEGKPYILKMAVQNRMEMWNSVALEATAIDTLSRTAIAKRIPSFPAKDWTFQYRLPEDEALFQQNKGRGMRPVNIVVLNYLEGESKSPETLSYEEIGKIGKFLAELHNANFEPNTSLQFAPKLDFRGLFSTRYPLTEEAKALFKPQQLAVMDKVAQTVKSAMDELGQGENEFGLIHGDFLLKNILFHEGEVRALDFEYCGWGYYLYDLMPLLWQLKQLSNYKELEEALWNGYNSIRPLTERHRQLLETFIAGRQVASMRWVAANQHNPAYQGKVESILQQRTAELQGFLETGILNRS